MADETFTPDEDDAYITDIGSAGYGVSWEGRSTGTFADMDEAVVAVAMKMNHEEFYPNVWFVNDHGNITLLSVGVDGEWEFTDTSYV